MTYESLFFKSDRLLVDLHISFTWCYSAFSGAWPSEEKLMKKKYLVRLSASERGQLTGLIRKGKAAAYRRTHAQILLQVDEWISRVFNL